MWGDDGGHGGLTRLAATVEEYALRGGAEELLLPGVRLQTQRTGERRAVQGQLQVGPKLSPLPALLMGLSTPSFASG